MRALTDTWTMTKRSLRHTTRSVDTIITVVLMPIALLLLFVYVFGGALEKQTGSIDYVDFITPGVVIMTVLSGIAYAAVRLSTDLQQGIISRFRTMPVTPSAVLSGQAVSSTLSNLFSCFIVVMVAFLVGFRPEAESPPGSGSSACWSSSRWPPPGWRWSSACWPRRRRRRRLQLRAVPADLHQPLVRSDRLHDVMDPGVRREPTDDTDRRNHAFTAHRRHDRARPRGRLRVGGGHPDRVVHARAARSIAAARRFRQLHRAAPVEVPPSAEALRAASVCGIPWRAASFIMSSTATVSASSTPSPSA